MGGIKLPGVPEGYEQVRWGFPKEGESFVCGSGLILTANFDFDTVRHLVVRKIWTMQEDLKLKSGRIFLNCGDWFWTRAILKPCMDASDGYWCHDTANTVNLSESTNFVGPDVTPENSLIEIKGN